MDEVLTEKQLGNIILCEPITEKGKHGIANLGIARTELTVPLFYSELYVSSKFEESSNFYQKGINDDEPSLYSDFSLSKEQFKILQERLTNFKNCLSGNRPDHSFTLLLLLGVAGNGKTIEIRKRLYDILHEENSLTSPRKAIIDLENSFYEIPDYGETFKCPDPDKAPWLFLIKLLEGVMKYLQNNVSLASIIADNYKKYFVHKNINNRWQRMFFKLISGYKYNQNFNDEDLDDEQYINGKNIFQSLVGCLSKSNEIDDICFVFQTFLYIMFCANPDPEKINYIVLDNIEEYIALDQKQIQIVNEDLCTIYSAVQKAVSNFNNVLEKTNSGISIGKTRIILVLRRTSFGILESTSLQNVFFPSESITDFTGHIKVAEIWKKKKEKIWFGIFAEKDRWKTELDSTNRWKYRLEKRYPDTRNQLLISIVDLLMLDDERAAGQDYQTLISYFVCHDIRRNAMAQAHAAYCIYNLVSKGSFSFERIKNLYEHDDSSRYMFRRALIEFQLKWSIGVGTIKVNGKYLTRWQHLNLGHLSINSENGTSNIHYVVKYDNEKHKTFVRRILTYLSYFPFDDSATNGKTRVKYDVFQTKSLYDLIEGVFLEPNEKERNIQKKIPEEVFTCFARVLTALGNMLFLETKTAPLIILNIKDSSYNSDRTGEKLKSILMKIWKAGADESRSGGKYDSKKYGVRITEAGLSFLIDWQASFSYFAALHCYKTPPLFFLNSYSTIKHVLETVHDQAKKLINSYEVEASKFCGENQTLKKDNYFYLPKLKNRHITFKQRVVELHVSHLSLYRSFLEKNYSMLGMDSTSVQKLINTSDGLIPNLINDYHKIENEERERDIECF